MKNKHGILAVIVGMVLVVVGASLKIMHATGANVFLLAGMLVKTAGLAWLIWKSARHASVRQWFNS